MKIFQNTTDLFRVNVYNALDLELIDRHHKWCNDVAVTKDKPIYMVFFLQKPEEIKQYKSNRLNNQFCLVYILDIPRDNDWIKKFCSLCFSDETMEITRAVQRIKGMRELKD